MGHREQSDDCWDMGMKKAVAGTPYKAKSRGWGRKMKFLLVFFALFLVGSGSAQILYTSQQNASEKEERDAQVTVYDTGSFSGSHHALFLSSYSPTFPTYMDQITGLNQSLYANDMDYDAEYLDSKNYQDDANRDLNYQTLKYRLAHHDPYDVVLAGDDAALSFVERYRNELFKDIPVVFFAVNDRKHARRAVRNPLTTGSIEEQYLQDTIVLAEKLLPKSEKVVEIVDDTKTGMGDQVSMRTIMPMFHNLSFEFLNTSQLSLSQFKEKVASYDDTVILIYACAFEDADGRHYAIPDTVKILNSCAKIPIFRNSSVGIGSGITGGKIYNMTEAAKIAGEQAARIVNDGISPSDIPLYTKSIGTYIFDDQMLEKYGLDKSLLPDGTVLVNMPKSFFRVYRKVLIPASFIAIGFLILLAVLADVYRRQVVFARKLARSEQRLRENSIEAQYAAEHDALTGMKNRYALEKDYPTFLNRETAILFFDVDNFKFFNDMYSHARGDEVLKAFGSILVSHFGEAYSYRYGGDEFLAVLADTSEEKCLTMAQDCIEALRHLDMDDVVVHPSSSCGYAFGVPAGRADVTEMIRQADVSAFDAKIEDKTHVSGGSFDPKKIAPEKLVSHFRIKAPQDQSDPVTGLPNIAFFIVTAEDLLKNVVDYSRKPVFVFLNVQGFAAYNQANGFRKGDDLLSQIASIIRKYWPNRLLSRVGADHFILMTYDENLTGQLQQLQNNVRRETGVSVQAGIYYNQPGELSNLCCDRAMLACNSIHQDKKRLYAVYDSSLGEMKARQQYIFDHIDEAIAAGHILTYYQPIMDAKTGRICHEEALVRWKDPVFGILSPAAFVPVLEQNHLTALLDLTMLDNVIRDLREKEKAGIRLVPVSINLSRYDFESCDMVEEICDRVDRSGYSRDFFVMEITESAFAKDSNLIRREVSRFREQGFQVWMDDFGSGYSTLNTLQTFEFDVMKIDMQFTKGLTRDSRNYVILSEMIQMADKLGIGTVCEGIETEDQEKILRELGCRQLQGYFFGKPEDLAATILKRLDA